MKAKRFPGTRLRKYGTNWGVINEKGQWGHDHVGNILAWRRKTDVDEWIANGGQATFLDVQTDEHGRLIDDR